MKNADQRGRVWVLGRDRSQREPNLGNRVDVPTIHSAFLFENIKPSAFCFLHPNFKWRKNRELIAHFRFQGFRDFWCSRSPDEQARIMKWRRKDWCSFAAYSICEYFFEHRWIKPLRNIKVYQLSRCHFLMNLDFKNPVLSSFTLFTLGFHIVSKGKGKGKVIPLQA